MITHDTDVVSMLRLAVADRIGQERFELWFGTGTLLTPRDGRVVVEVPNQFTLDWLRNNFRNDIEMAVSSVLGAAAAIEFRLNPKLGSTSEQAGGQPAGKSSPSGADKPTSSTLASEQPSFSRRRLAQLGSFIVGDCNRIAHSSADLVVRRLGSVTPLFLYGPTGVGKTHLLEGILSGVRSTPGRSRAVFLSAEQFTSFFIEALQGKGLPSFRRRYRDVELLIVDDVQFLVGKRATQAELHHTMDKLLREGRQLAFAADQPPSKITGLSEELVARFLGGLVCELKAPDYATRLGILRNGARQRPLAVPEEVLELIAQRMSEDARRLQGALNRVWATSEALGQPITLEMANQALADLLRNTRQVFGLKEIEHAVCGLFELDGRALKSNRRTKSVSHPRMLAMWLARKFTRAALSEIGDFFGRRSHATVISAQKTVNRWMQNGASVQLPDCDCQVEETIRQLEARLRAG